MNYLDKQTLLSSVMKAIDYLDEINLRSVAPSHPALENLSQFDEAVPFNGRDGMETIDFLSRYGSPATMASNGGRYYDNANGGTHTAALAANWLATAWDQNAGLAVTSPINAKIESVTERWLTEILPVAEHASVGFVTDVTMANFSALAAARSALLQNLDWDVEALGLYGSPRITVVVSEEASGSLLKALSMLGFGKERLIRVPTDENGRLRMGSIPPLNNRTIICLQAGNSNTGALDDGEIIINAKKSEAWVHIDGAIGLWTGASDYKQHLTRGYRLADSWATDCHTWLNVAYDSGLVICSNGKHLQRAMGLNENHSEQEEVRTPSRFTPELSKRARAIDVWAAIRTLGRHGIDDLITRTCVYAEFIGNELRASGFDVMNKVETNQVLVSFGSDEETRRVIQDVQSDGTCWCGGTVWKNRLAMRISITGSKTTERDIKRSLQSILFIAKKYVSVAS